MTAETYHSFPKRAPPKILRHGKQLLRHNTNLKRRARRVNIFRIMATKATKGRAAEELVAKAPAAREFGMKKRHFKDEFVQTARNPFWWVSRADSLRQAADILWRRYVEWKDEAEEFFAAWARGKPPIGGQLWMQAAMLLGLGVENILKALIVSDDPDLVRKCRVNWDGNGHDQIQLSKRANLEKRPKWTANPGDDRLFRLLTQFVEWGGRYPVRKAASAERSPTWSAKLWNDTCDLYDRLHQTSRFAFQKEGKSNNDDA